ncbi:hypothetical protein PCE1_001101 [Barthelona sp. PCE]
MSSNVLVLEQNTQREHGRKAQLTSIHAGKTVGDIIRTTLGPQAMLKMLVDPMAGVVITSDGHSILRDIDTQHPSARTLVDIARAQDEECGDGTTAVVVLAAEFLSAAEPFIDRNMHPTQIVAAYFEFLEKALKGLDDLSKSIDVNDRETMRALIKTAIGTKFISRWADLMVDLALQAVLIVMTENKGLTEVDLKKYARVEKIPGGEIETSYVLDGVMIKKDVIHGEMRRKIENPRIICLDTPLEYRKGESNTVSEVATAEDWDKLLRQEDEYVKRLCEDLLKFKPDIVVTEKGVSEVASHILYSHNVTVLRRLRKPDNIRLAKACGATIISRADEIREEDVGTKCHLYEVRKIGDEYISFFEECEDPKACSIILRGANKDVLNEVERNIQDAMNVAKNIVLDPRVVPGGGAIEMAIACMVDEEGKKVEGAKQWPYRAAARALEVIPRTLASNCGANVIRVITELRAKHAQGKEEASTFGIDGIEGTMVDMREYGIWEPLTVKTQCIKTAVEAACLLLRIDDILSGMSVPKEGEGPKQDADEEEMAEETLWGQ